MKSFLKSIVASWMTLLACFAQGTAFNYNGELVDNNAAANGSYDLRFTIHDSAINPSPLTTPLTNSAVNVTEGQFVTELDFGPIFSGAARWLEVSVRPHGDANFVTLTPRQSIKPTPYAMFAETAKNFTGVLGTTTSQPLDLLVNNQRALRLQSETAFDPPSVIGGSLNNSVITSAKGVFIGGGDGNTIAEGSDFTAIAGGLGNNILTNSQFSSIGAGYFNIISNNVQNAVIGGGNHNIIQSGSVSTIGGGWGNLLIGGWTTIAGGSANVAQGDGATVAGGAGNQAKAQGVAVGGGYGNIADGAGFGTISGGRSNQMIGNSADGVIAGGHGNAMTNSPGATISGGDANVIATGGQWAVISGGQGNVAEAPLATIIGGANNSVKGTGAAGNSTILGGEGNRVDATLSVAAGFHSSITHHGSFVWNSWNVDGTGFSSVRESEFAVRAPGGVRFETGTGGFWINGAQIGGTTDGSITTPRLADAAVTLPKLAIAGAPANGKVISYSDGALSWANPGSGVASGWSFTGNAGTTVANNFLGTTDNQPLELRVNNVRAFRLEPGPVGSSIPNVIGGSSVNVVGEGVIGATIAGGGSADFQTPALPNGISSDYGTISGGVANLIGTGASGSFIAGGSYNHVETGSYLSSIGGGRQNTIYNGSYQSVIGGGQENIVSSDAWVSTISGGAVNYVSAGSSESSIGGGSENNIGNNAARATIAGGYKNSVGSRSFSTAIAGGQFNVVSPDSASSAIGGGAGNRIESNSAQSAIAGGVFNTIGANSIYSSIGGGNRNMIAEISDSSTIAGGFQNRIGTNANSSVIAGGAYNAVQTNSVAASIGGGIRNSIRTNSGLSTISGGYENTVANFADFSAIGGGQRNTNAGNFATIPGGVNNFANGWSFAAGNSAKAIHLGAFVWSSQTETTSAANDSVTFRAGGGYRLFTDTGAAGAQLLPGATSWTAISDRNSKKNIQSVNSAEILEKLAQIPIAQWNYNWEPDNGVPNIGPMAQDFKAAFFPGRDDKGISTLEFDGVELAAIQGLHQKLEEQKAENAALKARLEKLEQFISQKIGGLK